MKKWIIFVLTAAMLLVGSTVLAENAAVEWIEFGDYVYVIDDEGNAHISLYFGEDSVLEIPEELEGHPVVEIKDTAISSPRDIWSVSLPTSLTTMIGNPFARCENLSGISVAEGNTAFEVVDGVLFSIEDQRLISYPAGLTDEHYDIPEGTQIIGDKAFYSASDCLTSIHMPDSLTHIGEYAFAYNYFRRIDIPQSITKISDGAFYFSVLASKVNIPQSVTEIGAGAFACSSNLTSIDIPEGVTSIGDEAFFDCNLKQISLPETLTSIGSGAFFECHFEEVTIPSSVTQMGANPFEGCASLSSIEIASGNTAFEIVNGALFSAEEGRLIGFPSGMMESSYVVPEGTRVIGEAAFRMNENLTEVVIPEGVESIGPSAFYYCINLASVELPQSVKEIGDMAFIGCDSLMELEIPEGAVLGEMVFSYEEEW